MPRKSETAKSLTADLAASLKRLVAAAMAEGRSEALAAVRALVARDGGEIPVPFRRGPGRPKGSKNKPKVAKGRTGGRKRRNSWAGLTPAQKLARVNAIRKGRGLPEKAGL